MINEPVRHCDVCGEQAVAKRVYGESIATNYCPTCLARVDPEAAALYQTISDMRKERAH